MDGLGSEGGFPDPADFAQLNKDGRFSLGGTGRGGACIGEEGIGSLGKERVESALLGSA